MNNIIFGDKPVNLLDSIYITVICISAVFFILILISIMITFFKYISKQENKVEIKQEKIKKQDVTKFNIEDLNDEEKLVATLVSIIECSENTNNDNIKIRSIREII